MVPKPYQVHPQYNTQWKNLMNSFVLSIFISLDDVIKWKHFPRYFCEGNRPVTGLFPAQRPVTQSFDVFLMCTWTNGCVNSPNCGTHCVITIMETVMLDVSNKLDELASDPLSPHLHLATLGLTEIKLLRLSFSDKSLLSGGRNMTRLGIKRFYSQVVEAHVLFNMYVHSGVTPPPQRV